MNVSDNSRLQDDKSSPDGVGLGSLKRKGSSEGSRSRRRPSTTRATSLEPILEEQRGVRLCEVGPLRNGGLPEEIGAGEGSDRISCSPISTQTQGPVRVCVEKWENLFGTTSKHEEETGGSLSRRKHLRTSSLSSLLPSQNRNTSLSPSPGPTFARTFQESSPPAVGISSRLAVNKSASECNLAQWVGRPSVRGREELKLITEYLGIDTSVVEKPGNTNNRMVSKEEAYQGKKVVDIDGMLEETLGPGSLKPEHGNSSFTEKGMSVTRHEVPPLSDGLYYATPVLLADCSESEESDTESDTCQTVIHTSPYSSPGGALSRSASAVLTPIPPSPLTLPSSPDSPPPPPRPPPPLHYTPSQFSSLPRNWGKMRGVET